MRFSHGLMLIYVAGFLRSLGVGLLGVVLAVYLSRVGVSATSIGLVIGVGLLGACAAIAVVAWVGTRIGCRASLVALSLLAAVGGLGLVALPAFPLLLLFVFMGMVNGMGTDRSAAFALEQAIIPGLVPDRNRTWGLSWYNALLDNGGAPGALGAGVPLAVSAWAHLDLIAAYRYLFVGYACSMSPSPRYTCCFRPTPHFCPRRNQQQESSRLHSTVEARSIVLLLCSRLTPSAEAF